MAELFDFACRKLHETKPDSDTEGAYLVTTDDDDKIWLPKKLSELVQNKDGRTWTATIPMWLAVEKKLICTNMRTTIFMPLLRTYVRSGFSIASKRRSMSTAARTAAKNYGR